MVRRVRRIAADLSGRSHRHVVHILMAQIDAALDGAALSVAHARGEMASGDARRRMTVVEHAGDEQRARLVSELSARLTTPIDREDLYRFSRSVDDVLDNMRDYVRECDLYAVADNHRAVALLVAVAETLTLLRDAVDRLPGRPAEVTQAALGTHKRAGRVRQLYQVALADLLHGAVDAEMLRHRELLRRLDVVGLRLCECAEVLSDAMMKRSL